MKIHIFLLLLLLTGCYSTCFINGDKKYLVENSCGKAELSVKLFRASLIAVVVKSVEGDFILNADSVLVENLNPEALIYPGYYYDKGQKNSGNILLKKGKKISNYTSIYYPIDESKDILLESYREFNKTYIPPNSLIMCNDEPLIKDTLWISKPWPYRWNSPVQ